MDRNTTIAFILIGGILVLWLYFNSPTPPPPQKGGKADTTQVHHDTTNVQATKVPEKEPVQKENAAS